MRASKMGRERELERQSDCKKGSPEESINYDQQSLGTSSEILRKSAWQQRHLFSLTSWLSVL